VVKH